MKGEKRPQMLLYLLVGALLLSTALNAWFLLRLDGKLVEQELVLEQELRDQSKEPLPGFVQLPAETNTPPDSLQ